jgi:hypothetical protein
MTAQILIGRTGDTLVSLGPVPAAVPVTRAAEGRVPR